MNFLKKIVAKMMIQTKKRLRLGNTVMSSNVSTSGIPRSPDSYKNMKPKHISGAGGN
jgi:hypothetical protein